MRIKKKYIIFTFESTHDAMAMEAMAKKEQIPGRLIPLPSQVSAGCGLAWRVLPEEYEGMEQIAEQFHYEAIHEVELF